MPISRDEFEKGRTVQTVISMVEDLLKNNSEKAYSLSEIIEEVYGKPSSIPFAILQYALNYLPITTALNDLINEGKVTRNRIQKAGRIEEYYIWKV
jgi:hypothetical protein